LKIAVDPWVLSSRFNYHGMQVYARNLLAEFRRLAPAQDAVKICLFSSDRHANGFHELGSVSGFEIVRAPSLRFDRFWRLGGLSRAASSIGADMIFSPTANMLPSRTVPVVCTIHDLTPVTEPSHGRKINALLKTFMWASAKFARSLITVSECSRNDIVEHYQLPPEKVRVVYNGFDRAIFNTAPFGEDKLAQLRTKFGINAPYIAHHGTIQPRKNQVRLIQAYDLLLDRHPALDLQLVLMGPLGWRYQDVLRQGGRTRSKGKVIFTQALPDGDLSVLLKGAFLAVMPSLYEGFCMPMIEAMACGIPTIAANSSCLPEISGNVLRYFDALSTEDMADKMESAILDTGLREQLRRDGLERSNVFSWERCARETIEVLIQAGSRPRPAAGGA
jgi:glycosyltransferase involved in cell wall biosynthesis